MYLRISNSVSLAITASILSRTGQDLVLEDLTVVLSCKFVLTRCFLHRCLQPHELPFLFLGVHVQTLKGFSFAEHDHGPGGAEGRPLELRALGVIGSAEVLQQSLTIS